MNDLIRLSGRRGTVPGRALAPYLLPYPDSAQYASLSGKSPRPEFTWIALVTLATNKAGSSQFGRSEKRSLYPNGPGFPHPVDARAAGKRPVPPRWRDRADRGGQLTAVVC